jgi:predicted nucleic acid-binding protein
VKRGATFDSSFWVHAVYLDLVEFLLQDYELFCTPAVENELGQANPTGLRLKALLADGLIKPDKVRWEKVKLYGDGERAAINLALDRRLLLLIDDWKPYQAAIEYGVEVVSSLVYLVRLYEQDRISAERVLDALAKMMRRGTVKPEWILEALKMVALIRERKLVKGD